ncbi:acyl-CoA dehydrogenase [Frankia sp. R82]|uniref:acyl-CoA dehydrogenase n=1 Tax=Frankia sp. R82 TaxID=2950553 RepID=UPI002044A33B|nr:acyl-CoA dehydrogenase [Frankia sp. R82]MCM3883688.1 acyl-CoA dehydrogenase [Frankia sp. R82]
MPLAITDDHRALAEVVRDVAVAEDLRALTRRAVDALPPPLEGPPSIYRTARPAPPPAHGSAQHLGGGSAQHQSGAGASAGGGEAPPGVGDSWAESAWRRMTELGWLGLHLPEEYGGSGFGLAELAIVGEGLGGQVAGGPFLSTVAASAVIAAVGGAELRAALLPGLVDGSRVASLATAATVIADAAGTVGVAGTSGTAGAPPAGLLLDGEVPAALGGVWAGIHLVPVGADDLVVVVADAPGLTVRPAERALDPSLGLAALTLRGVAPHPAGVLPGGRAVAVRVLRVLAAAEAAGGARATLTMALEHAKIREQFGRVIGGFQAVKHHLANMFVQTELATAAAWDAARAFDGGPAGGELVAGGELAVVAAAALALPAYEHNARLNIQLHGGIGFTWEHDAHLHLRRAAALAVLAGPVDGACEDVAALVRAGVTRRFAVELPPQAEQYRRQARAFVERYFAAPEAERRGLLADSGYLVPHWAKPWGRGAGPVEQLVVEAEFAGVDVPDLAIGGWVLLSITQHGTPEQIARWLPPSLHGDLVWCQLFSEPNAGSDAAAVTTRADRVDGGWRITGQKVWTTGARSCNRGLATVRTDPSATKHRGITTVAIDLTGPGVEIRPLREITGEALFNEVFFDDVFVPDADVVGPVGAGWTVARAVLGNERVSIGGGSGGDRRSVARLPELQARYAAADVGVAREVGHLLAVTHALDVLNLRSVQRAVVGAGPSPEGNVSKLAAAECAQQASELAVRIAGAAVATGAEAELGRAYLMGRALTIAGGTSEISRNVIAERILGLPREPGLR